MKTLILASQIFVLTLLTIPSHGRACGTIPGWVEKYFDETHSMQDQALCFIHCEPILEEQYKATLAQHKLLARMIAHALKNGNKCDKNLAIKNYFMFDQLFWLRETKIHDEIRTAVEKRFDLSTLKSVQGAVSPWDWSDRDVYCKRVAKQVADLRHSETGRQTAGRRIDLTRLEKRAKKVKRFLDKTDKCLSVESVPSEVELLRVTGNNLALRSRQDTKSKALKRFKSGTFLRVLKVADGGWAEVMDATCNKGWVAVHRTKDAQGD